MNSATTRGRVQDLFDGPLLTSLGANSQSFRHEDEHAGKITRFGTLEAKGSNSPLKVFFTNSPRRV